MTENSSKCYHLISESLDDFSLLSDDASNLLKIENEEKILTLVFLYT